MVEQPIRNRQVVGSTPTLGSIFSLNLRRSNVIFQFLELFAQTLP